MTVILSYVENDYAFLASDSFRWDLIQRRNLGPVKKLHQVSDDEWFGLGGQAIDRDHFAREWGKRLRAGDDAILSAKLVAAPLFKAKEADAVARNISQMVVTFHLRRRSGALTVDVHQLPQGIQLTNVTREVMGPKSDWLRAEWAKVLATRTASDGKAPLDLVARDVIAAASAKWPTAVGFPIHAVILRTSGRANVRRSMTATSRANPRFKVKV